MKKIKNCDVGTKIPHLTKLLRVMKVTCFLIMIVLVQVSASTYSQSAKLTLDLKNVTVDNVLESIEESTEFRFFYDAEYLNLSKKVTLTANNANIKEILNDLLNDTQISYEIYDRYIILKSKSVRGSSDRIFSQQQKSVSGTVTDESGQPLPGVTVVVKGTTQGTVTNADGNYSLTNIPEDATLQFSFMGMRSQEIEVNNQNEINVIMETETIGIEEVVAIGYGTQKKINLTGSVSEVKSDVLEDRALISVADALQGTAANVNLLESDLGGEPGANRSLNIRGMGTLTGGGGEPYVIVDGIPMDISDVNPNDIESVSVLKDAAAAAIYGSRAPFGVIIITTKQGKGKELTFDYSYNYSLRHPTMIARFASSVESALSHQYMMENSGRPGYSEDQMERIFAYYNGEIDYETVPRSNKPNEWGFSPSSGANANNDVPTLAWDHWSPQHQHHLSASGEKGRTSYYLSGGYYEQNDIMEWGDEFHKKYDFSTNLSSEINDWLTVDVNVKYNHNKLQRPVASKNGERMYQWGWVYTNTPLHALYSPNGDLLFQLARENELGGREHINTDQYWIKVGGILEPVKGWKTNINYSWRNKSERFTRHKKTVYYPLVDGTEYAWRYTTPSFTDIMSQEKYNILNFWSSYEKTFGEHNFMVMAGYEDEYLEFYKLGGVKTKVISPEVPSIATSSGDFSEESSWIHWATQGIFMRLNYNFKEKFLFELNGRYDGSSRFEGANNQWGFFPSISVGYNISKEPFWDSVRNSIKMDNLKVRASFGSLGNQDVSNYLYLPIIGTHSGLPWIIGSQKPDYTTVPALVSPELTWETSTTLNVGLDLSFFNNRLNANFDWFERKTSDMFGPAEKLPAVLGTSPSLRNNAELRTRGFDLSIDWRGRIAKDLTYNVNIVLGDNKSVVTKYNNPTGLINYNINGNYSWYEGGTVGDIWGYVTEGIFQSDEEAADHADQTKIYSRWLAGDIAYKDLNNDEKIDWGDNTLNSHGDLKIIGNNQPRYQYGLNTSLKYKGFDLNIFFQGVGKRDYFFYGYNTTWSRFWGFRGSTASKGLTEFTKDYWTPEGSDFGGGPDAFYPKPYASSEYRKNLQTQTRYLQDASYLRLKNIRIGYTIPENLTKKIKVDKLRIYLSGNNILTFTKLMQKFDPESLSNDVFADGLGTTVYPIQKFYTIGVNISF